MAKSLELFPGELHYCVFKLVCVTPRYHSWPETHLSLYPPEAVLQSIGITITSQNVLTGWPLVKGTRIAAYSVFPFRNPQISLVRKASRNVKLPGPLCPPTSFLWVARALPSATQFTSSLPYCVYHNPQLLFLLPCSQLNSYCLRGQVPARELTLEFHSTKCDPAHTGILFCIVWMPSLFLAKQEDQSLDARTTGCVCFILNKWIEVAECKSSTCKAKY